MGFAASSGTPHAKSCCQRPSVRLIEVLSCIGHGQFGDGIMVVGPWGSRTGKSTFNDS